MIRFILVFLITFAIFFFGITGFRSLSGKVKWELTKILFYSIICAVLSIVTLGTIVVLF